MPPVAQSSNSSRTGIVIGLGLLLLLKSITWIAGYWLAQDMSAFQAQDYARQFHHYRLLTPDSLRQPRSFFSLWNYADGEWYLSIAAHGYPTQAELVQSFRMPQPAMRYTEKDPFLKYAFFPLFPLCIAAAGTILGLEPAAFVVVLLFSLAAGVCFLTFLRVRFAPQSERHNTILLLFFLYPFSIFYNLYHTESLFLLLSLLCFLCLYQKRYLVMWVCGFLLCVTRPNGLFIAIPLLYGVYRDREATDRTRGLLCALAIPLGLLPYAWLNWRNVGNPFFFSTVLSSWGYMIKSAFGHFRDNLITTGTDFLSLGFHRFHSSQLDYIVMLLFAVVLVVMWLNREFPKQLTLWSSILWLVPMLSKDLMSFSRYMCVSFPVFLFVGSHSKRWVLYLLLAVFCAGYLWALARVIHYQWLG
jgi:hypothetical protein